MCISLDEAPVSEADSENSEEALGKQIDDQLIRSLFEALCAPKTHHQRTYTIGELWRSVYGQDGGNTRMNSEEVEAIRTACRQLSRANLVKTGAFKKGNSTQKTNSATSSKGRRSSSHEVFKVGLSSQAAKQRIQRALADEELALELLIEIEAAQSA